MCEKNYRIKEMYPTLQGEGYYTGRTVVLLRFQECNLSCSFCDTDFAGTDGPGGGVFSSPVELAEAVAEKWPGKTGIPAVLCTGGEPLLQLDEPLVEAFHSLGFQVLLETNGTFPVPGGVDWVCVSPKSDRCLLREGDELKIVWPSEAVDPDTWAETLFGHFWLQPKYDESYEYNLRLCIDRCLEDPRWRLSLQTHRYIGMP
ncbi:7-carboxy-7-deazaguanine synthase [Candidatus Fermentibacteria bacterium]|nr:MAG: 7-carboxy-7-deazaguanine synthase [Candidatus Fermentibacteria bacterium]PIE52289.1 MAG: 7-carboxy-7-deazaguanine synthase [Candidatus Fermentibacteria bacterium]PIE52784.1 MAG: 7-carboxy-7-deazaguanine synthase [Candidatus Fermentibacteria bacterium]